MTTGQKFQFVMGESHFQVKVCISDITHPITPNLSLSGKRKPISCSAAVQYLIYLARESRYWAKRKLSPISALPCQKKRISDPGGGLDKPTDRDQRSWVFLNDPKNTLPLTENPKEYFSKSKTLKNTLKTLFISQKSRHDMITMETHDY